MPSPAFPWPYGPKPPGLPKKGKPPGFPANDPRAKPNPKWPKQFGIPGLAKSGAEQTWYIAGQLYDKLTTPVPAHMNTGAYYEVFDCPPWVPKVWSNSNASSCYSVHHSWGNVLPNQFSNPDTPPWDYGGYELVGWDFWIYRNKEVRQQVAVKYRRQGNAPQGATFGFPAFYPEALPNVAPNIDPFVVPPDMPLISPEPVPFRARPWVNPQPYPAPRPRPQPKPKPVPIAPGTWAYPWPGTKDKPTVVIQPPIGVPDVGPWPGASPSPVPKPRPTPVSPPTSGHTRKPPDKDTVEHKATVKGAVGVAFTAANVVSEALDELEAAWKALPDKYKTKVKGKATSPGQMWDDIWAANNDPDFDGIEWIGDFLFEKSKNEAGDRKAAYVGGFNADANKENPFFGGSKGRGYSTGRAL